MAGEDSPTTETVRPFGLDCSGYVTWIFVNAAGTAYVVDIIGNDASNQYVACTPRSWNRAQPGDLAFFSDLSHVGIVVGEKNGNLLIAHCSSSQNNVVLMALYLL